MDFGHSTDLIYVRAFDDGSVYVNDIKGNLYGSNVNLIETSITDNNVVVHPNPTKDFINISISPAIRDYEISMYDLQGEKVLSTKENRINIENIKAGVYFIVVTTGNQTYHTKVVKQ